MPKARYVIAHNNVYSIKDIIHPGGNYIIRQVNGREIDCFLFGGYALETTTRLP